MGAYLSVPQCQSRYNITINCHVENSTSIGGIEYGQFQPDPDVAGTGVVNVFFGVTAFALAISVIYLFLQLTSHLHFTGLGVSKSSIEGVAESDRKKVSISEIFERLVLSCSDQQIFTGGAYTLTLRYSKGCEISAYHYNIVANMMLMTCATHLMALSVVSKYWEHKLLAVFRVGLVSGIYIVTGLLLSNQNAASGLAFPTSPPPANQTFSPMVLPAACFQGNAASLATSVGDSFVTAEDFGMNTVLKSTPGDSKVQGWNFYILTVLWFGVAIIAELGRYIWRRRRNSSRLGASNKERLRKFVDRAFWVYQFLGFALGAVMIYFSRMTIVNLRAWMNDSPWIRLSHGINLENDPTSFGQLVPIFLVTLTLFTFVEMINDKVAEHCRGRPATPSPDLEFHMQSPRGTFGPPEKKDGFSVQVASVPPTPGMYNAEEIFPVSSPSMSPTPSLPPQHPRRPRIQTFDTAQFGHASPQPTARYHHSTLSSGSVAAAS